MEAIATALARSRRPKIGASEEFRVAVVDSGGRIAAQITLQNFAELAAFAGEMVGIGYCTRQPGKEPDALRYDAMFIRDFALRVWARTS